MRNTWPFWEHISSEALVRLAEYQWSTYGTKLDILAQEQGAQVFIESLQEIDRLMRQKPKSPRRVT